MREPKETSFDRLGEILYLLYALIGLIIAIANMAKGQVPHPRNSVIVAVGVALFIMAKASVIKNQEWLTFGTRGMSQMMANFYRVGWWITLIGILLTFVK